jgi:hypothetical protein
MVLVIVRIKAITESSQYPVLIHSNIRGLTNQTQPDHANQSHDSQNRKTNPQGWCHVQAQPEESLIGSCHGADVRVGRLKDPVRVAGCGVHFVPPAETDQSASGNVLEIIEVCGEKEKGEDEDEDTICLLVGAGSWRRGVHCRVHTSHR